MTLLVCGARFPPCTHGPQTSIWLSRACAERARSRTPPEVRELRSGVAVVPAALVEHRDLEVLVALARVEAAPEGVVLRVLEDVDEPAVHEAHQLGRLRVAPLVSQAYQSSRFESSTLNMPVIACQRGPTDVYTPPSIRPARGCAAYAAKAAFRCGGLVAAVVSCQNPSAEIP